MTLRPATVFVVVVVIALFLSSPARGGVPPYDALDLVLFHGQYVTGFVGAEGREVVFRVRFDCDHVAVYSPVAAGTSYDNTTQTDHVSLGAARGFRWRVRYTSQGDPLVSDPGDTDERTAHQGVLGLGPRSPVWDTFDSVTFAPTRLVLGWQMDSGATFANGANVSLDPGVDYTYVAWDVLAGWMAESARDSDFVARVELSPGVYVLVPMNDSSKNKPLVQVLQEDSASAIVLGFVHLRNLAISQTSAMRREGVWKVSAVASSSIPVRLGEYLWLFVGVFFAAWCWYPSFCELLLRVYWAYPSESGRPRERALREANWSLVSSVATWIVLLTLMVVHGSLASYKSMQVMSEPYGSANSALALVVYYVIVSVVLAIVAFSGVERLSMPSVAHRASAFYLLGWLVLVVRFDEPMNIIFMVWLSALVFVRQSDLLIRETYLSRPWYRVMAWTLTTLAAGWFFAFYTLAEYIDERWPGHPSAFFLELFALAVTWAIGSFEPFVREHSVHLREVAKKLSGDPRVTSSVSESQRPAQVPLAYAFNASTGGVTGSPQIGQGF